MSQDREQLLTAFDEHRDALFGYLARQFGNTSLAEDIVQETWLRIASQRVAEGIGNPRAYLFRIATNIGTDHQRHQNMGIEIPGDEQTLEQVPSMTCDPARSIEAHSELQHLLAIVDSLPPRCREVFMLCRVQGLSHAEVAERLGISKSTVVGQMVKAIARLEEGLR